ncbi:MAG TPA: PAS domain S-box protein [Albitalea sp.]|nr:PAS domain S-box protein [Albitalea sp.]
MDPYENIKALRHSEERFRTLAEQIADGIFISDEAGHYLDVNTAGARMLGYTRDEILALTIADVVTPDEAARIAPEIARLRNGQTVTSTWRFRRKDGSDFVGEVNVRQLPDSRLLATLRDATERERAREALRQSEARLREAQELAKIGSWELDLVTNRLTWSDEVYRIFELSPTLGENYEWFLRAVHPDDRERVDRSYTESVRNRTPYEIEHRLLMADGRIKYVHERGKTDYDANGKPVRSIGTVQDLTGQHKVEEELRASQRFIEAVAKASPPYIYVFDMDTLSVSYTNRSILVELGYPAEEAEVQRLAEFSRYMPIEDRPRLTAVLSEWRELRDGQIREGEHRLLDARGATHCYLGREVVFSRHPDGRVQRVLGTLYDITERKEMERALRDSESRLAGIINTALDAIITVDAQHRVVVFNQAAERMFGVPAAEALGGTLDRFIPQRVREAHRAHVAGFARDGGTARVMGHEAALIGLRANGEEFPVEASISRVGEGEHQLLTVKARDVTGAREARRARERQLAAEAASRAKTEFLSRMSHELRTPLNAVLGFSELLLLQSNGSLSPHQASEVEHIRQAGQHLTELINDLLDVSCIELGALQVELSDVDLITVLDEAQLMVQARADAAGIALIPRYRDAAPLHAQANPIRLRQVMINLLNNAIKYNHRGGSVCIDVKPRAGAVGVEIADSGMGMTREQLAHLFVPFDRLGRESSGVEGVGIGLALTQQLVTLMKGKIRVDSELGRGTTVCVDLQPAVRESGPPRAAAAIVAPSDAPARGIVLYIEDDAVNALLLERMLAVAGWPAVKLARANDGRTGLDMARSLRPDLILLDMRLPDMAGIDVLHALRADPATRGLRVIALSASAAPDEVDAARQAGAVDYWTKPLELGRFLADLKRALAVGVP